MCKISIKISTFMLDYRTRFFFEKALVLLVLPDMSDLFAPETQELTIWKSK